MKRYFFSHPSCFHTSNPYADCKIIETSAEEIEYPVGYMLFSITKIS